MTKDELSEDMSKKLTEGEIKLAEGSSWLSDYIKTFAGGIDPAKIMVGGDTATSPDFPSIMPMAMKVAAATIGLDLVSVKPMSAPTGHIPYLEYSYGGSESSDTILVSYDGDKKRIIIDVIFEHDSYYLRIRNWDGKHEGVFGGDETKLPMGILSLDTLINMFSGKEDYMSIHRHCNVHANPVFSRVSGECIGVSIVRRDDDGEKVYQALHYIDKDCADSIVMMLKYFQATGEIKDIII